MLCGRGLHGLVLLGGRPVRRTEQLISSLQTDGNKYQSSVRAVRRLLHCSGRALAQDGLGQIRHWLVVSLQTVPAVPRTAEGEKVPIPAVSVRNKVRAQDFRMRPCEAS